MTTNEKIAALRAAAQAAGAHGVLLMTSDPHSSEYLPAYYNSLPFFSGFTGENSTLVVTLTGSALWCDGRFYVQGDRQLAGTEIECMHAGSASPAEKNMPGMFSRIRTRSSTSKYSLSRSRARKRNPLSSVRLKKASSVLSE